MRRQDKEDIEALWKVHEGVTRMLANTFRDAWRESEASLAFFKTHTHGNARAEAFVLLLAHTLARTWLADALLSLLRTPDAHVPMVLGLAEELPLGWEKAGFGEALLNRLFLLWLAGTKVGREREIARVILHLTQFVRFDQTLFAMWRAQEVGKLLLKWVAYQGPTTREVQAKGAHELGRALGVKPKGQPTQRPLRGESIEDFYARRIVALMEVYTGAQQDFTRVDYRPFFSFLQPSSPEDQALRPQWFARAPHWFNRLARHAMGHALPIVTGMLERARWKSRDKHADLLAQQTRDPHTDAEPYLHAWPGEDEDGWHERSDDKYLNKNASAVDHWLDDHAAGVDEHLKAEQILQVARERFGDKGFRALSLIRLGKTQAEVATKLGVTDRTVRIWLDEIRKMLA